MDFGAGSGTANFAGADPLEHKSLVSQLRRHGSRANLIWVCRDSEFNRAMYQALSLACPAVPYVTVLTDLADFPPHFWIEPHQAQHVICGTPRRSLKHRPQPAKTRVSTKHPA